MKLDMVVGSISVLTFFWSFYTYAKARNLRLSSTSSMNDYFSGLFFLRGEWAGLIPGRVSLFLGIPFINIYKYVVGGSNSEYFPLIISVWIAVLYFWLFSRYCKKTNAASLDFFKIFLLDRGESIQGVFLWFVRVMYILSVAYVFWVRR